MQRTFHDDFFKAPRRWAHRHNGTTSEDRTNYSKNAPKTRWITCLARVRRMGHLVGHLAGEARRATSVSRMRNVRVRTNLTPSPKNSSPRTPSRPAIRIRGRSSDRWGLKRRSLDDVKDCSRPTTAPHATLVWRSQSHRGSGQGQTVLRQYPFRPRWPANNSGGQNALAARQQAKEPLRSPIYKVGTSRPMARAGELSRPGHDVLAPENLRL